MGLHSKLSALEDECLYSVSRALQVDPDWLYALINFESKWDPQAKNPYSTARGLIQFTDSTAKKTFGYADADDLVKEYPDRISQLEGPVYKYLSVYSPFPTQQSLAMAVYFPAYRFLPPDTKFPADTLAYNPGIVTINDYVKKVFGINFIAPLIVLGIITFLVFVFSKVS